jgi:GT2 family glycosyltransferase
VLDSAGIARVWYGKWEDVGQGQPVSGISLKSPYQVKALCGALFAIRTVALKEVSFPSGDIFDPSFYMYKEDIDLSIRLAEKKWELWIDPTLIAHHCRGWNSQSRKAMPRKMRLASARNECVIQWKLKAPLPILYSTIKYLAVKGLDI